MSLGNFHKLLRFGFVFSVSPWYDADKRAFKYQTFNRAYSVFLTAFSIASYVFSVTYFEWNYNTSFLNGKFLSFEMVGATSIAMIYLLVRQNRKKMIAWKRLLDNLQTIDEILHRAFGVTVTDSFYSLLVFAQVTVVVGYSCYYTFYYLKLRGSFNLVQGNAYATLMRALLDFTIYISLLASVISAALMKILCNRFVALKAQIKRMQRADESKREIMALKICIVRLLDNVRLYNEIFGNFFFCLIVKTTVEFQMFLMFFIHQSEYSNHSYFPIQYIIKTASSSLLSWFCSVYIIFSCDSVREKLSETRKNCFDLYLRSMDDWSIDSQRDVSDVVDLFAYNPKFIAGNVFEIRREVVLNILDITAACVLATVQLNVNNNYK